MGRRWHYSTQSKTEAPVDSSQLRRLAREGVLKPDDLVRKQGSRRWVKAKRIKGLFTSRPKWSYQHRGQTYGPVTDRQLRSLATARMLQPEDLVWREGLPSWIEARRLRGLFPSQGEKPSTPAPQAAGATRPSTSHRRSFAFLALLAGVGLTGVAFMLPRETNPEPAVERVAPAPPPAKPSLDPTAIGEPLKTTSLAEPIAAAPAKPAVAMDEPTVGRLVRERFMLDRSEVQDSELVVRITSVAAPLLKDRARKDVEYHFQVLDSDEVDAYSHAGGYIYLTRGLLSLVADEAELSFVLGHEIAHVDLRHGRSIGDGVETLAADVAAVHSEAEEYAADQWARQRLGAAGFADFETLSFLRRYRNYCDRKAMDAADSTRRASSGAASSSHWGSGPSPASRLARLQPPAA